MIRSFKHKGLEEFFITGSLKGIQAAHADKLGRILDRLDASANVKDMNLPSFKLHKLSGKKNDIYSVWVNGNWRVTFKFEDGDAYIVDYLDYHQEGKMNKRKPTHPGAILRYDVLEPLGITVTDAAKDLGISRKTLSEFLNKKSSLSPVMALRIARATNTTPESWMNMQTKLDLWHAGSKKIKIRPFKKAI